MTKNTVYAISAYRKKMELDPTGTFWECSYHLPIFYLYSNVQGILNEDGAVKVAADILDVPTDQITAVKL